MPPTSRRAGPWVVFALGLAIFLTIRMNLACQVHPASLNFPLWDTHFYLSKAAQLKECFRQECPALKDLKLQFAAGDHKGVQDRPGSGPDRDGLVRGDLPGIPQYLRKFWAYHCILHIYHPVQSFAVVTLSQISQVSLEAAYRYFNLFGMMFLTVAVAVFLLSLTDVASAGIALGLLAVAVFPYHGFRTVSPAALSLGFGLLMFVCLTRTKGNPGLPFFILNVLSLGFHKIGLVLSGLAVVYGVAYRYPQPFSRSLRSFIPSFVIMALYFILIHTVQHPALIAGPLVSSPGNHYFLKVIEQLKFITKILLRWLRKQGTLLWPLQFHQLVKQHWHIFALIQILGLGLWLWGRRLSRTGLRFASQITTALLLLPSLLILGLAAMLATILAVGFGETVPEKRRSVLLLFGLLTASLFLGCFFVQHGFRAQLSTRLFMVWQVVATAIFARGIMVAITARNLGDFGWSHRLASYLPRLFFSRYSWRLLLAGFLVIGVAPRLAESYEFLRDYDIWLKRSQDFSLNREQTQLLLKNTSPHDIVLYDDEMVLAYFLTHGALNRRAVFLPTLPLPSGPIPDPAAVKAMVARNPYIWLNPDYPGEYRAYYPLRLPPGCGLELHLEPYISVEALEIFSPRPPAHAPPAGNRLVIQRSHSEAFHQQEVIISANEWRAYGWERIIPGGIISLKNPEKDRSIYIGGLRLLPVTPSHHLWPWQGVEKVVWLDNVSKDPYWFAPPRDFSLQGERYQLQVVHDGGANVLWRLIWKGRNQKP